MWIPLVVLQKMLQKHVEFKDCIGVRYVCIACIGLNVVSSRACTLNSSCTLTHIILLTLKGRTCLKERVGHFTKWQARPFKYQVKDVPVVTTWDQRATLRIRKFPNVSLLASSGASLLYRRHINNIIICPFLFDTLGLVDQKTKFEGFTISKIRSRSNRRKLTALKQSVDKEGGEWESVILRVNELGESSKSRRRTGSAAMKTDGLWVEGTLKAGVARTPISTRRITGQRLWNALVRRWASVCDAVPTPNQCIYLAAEPRVGMLPPAPIRERDMD